MVESKSVRSEEEVAEELKQSGFRDFNELNRYLHELDERGQVLSLAAFAEDNLGKLLEAFLQPTKSSAQLIEGFNAPLGTFSARIKICFSLGLISTKQFNDLEQLRHIRNAYAHTWRQVTFEDSSVAGRIAALHYSRMETKYPETLRDKLLSSLTCLLIELQVMTTHIRKNKQGAKTIAHELYSGFPGDFEQQLDEATKHFAYIESGIGEADKGKRDFYIHLLEGFPLRLGTLSPRKPERLKLVLELREATRLLLYRINHNI